MYKTRTVWSVDPQPFYNSEGYNGGRHEYPSFQDMKPSRDATAAVTAISLSDAINTPCDDRGRKQPHPPHPEQSSS